MKSLIASIRLVIVTMLICVAGYSRADFWGRQDFQPRHRRRFLDQER